MQRDVVPGDRNCCFTSIATALNKLVESVEKNENGNSALLEHLNLLGIGETIEEDTTRLRQLFCEKIDTNQQNYQTWVDCDVQQEIEKFSRSGWFDSSLGDICVLACSNILKFTIVVITSITSVPYILFIPKELITDNILYIAFNHSTPGHYDATKGSFFLRSKQN